MTAIFALVKLAWPYMLAAAVGGWAAGWTIHAFDGIELNHQKTAMASYRTQVADAEADAQKAAREALQAQIDQQHAVDRNNQQVMDDLRKRTTDAESHYDADRAFIHSMLNSASKAGVPAGGEVREGQGGSGTAAAGPQVSTQQMAEQLCADTKAEDQWNADRFDALNAQLNGQIQP